MRSCYIAGPMRSKPKFNYPAFHAAARQLRAAQWTVFNPAEQDVLRDEQPDNFLEMTLEEQRAHSSNPTIVKRYAKRDLEMILSLHPEYGDAIVVLPDWNESLGARAEISVGRWLGLEILKLDTALEANK